MTDPKLQELAGETRRLIAEHESMKKRLEAVREWAGQAMRPEYDPNGAVAKTLQPLLDLLSDKPEEAKRCSCPKRGGLKLNTQKYDRDPDCPVHGGAKRCPTCGSDDPAKPARYQEGTIGGQMVGMEPRGKLHICPDPFHSSKQVSNG